MTAGGTLSKLLENLKESGIIREYPKYGKARVDKEKLNTKIEAFMSSNMHKNTQSVQVVFVTTMGLVMGEHASAANHIVTLDDIFCENSR